MSKCLFFFLCTFLFFACVGSFPVIILTQNNFDNTINSGDWLIEFCKPSNKACQDTGPIFDEVAKRVRQDFRAARVDVSSAPELASLYRIEYLPTIFLLKDGELREFDLEPTYDNLLSFAQGDYQDVEPEPIPGQNAEEDVTLQLNAKNFDQVVQYGRWLIQIGAPWCSHCRDIEGIWNDLALTLFNEDPHLKTGYLDGSKAMGIVDRYEINGFPTFLFFENGEYYEYTGQHDLDGLLNFVHKTLATSRPIPPRSPLYILRYEYYDTYSKWVLNNLKLSIIALAVIFVIAGFLTGLTTNIFRKLKSIGKAPKKLPTTSPMSRKKDQQKRTSPRVEAPKPMVTPRTHQAAVKKKTALNTISAAHKKSSPRADGLGSPHSPHSPHSPKASPKSAVAKTPRAAPSKTSPRDTLTTNSKSKKKQ